MDCVILTKVLDVSVSSYVSKKTGKTVTYGLVVVSDPDAVMDKDRLVAFRCSSSVFQGLDFSGAKQWKVKGVLGYNFNKLDFKPTEFIEVK
jgi:hypothetical protein